MQHAAELASVPCERSEDQRGDWKRTTPGPLPPRHTSTATCWEGGKRTSRFRKASQCCLNFQPRTKKRRKKRKQLKKTIRNRSSVKTRKGRTKDACWWPPGEKKWVWREQKYVMQAHFFLCFVFFPCSLTARSFLYGKER